MPVISWGSWGKGDSPPPEDSLASQLKRRLETAPLSLYYVALGSFTTVAAALYYTRYGRRIRSSGWVTPDILDRKPWVKGVVTSVGDADNFRFYHTPGFGWRRPFKFRRVPSLAKDLRDETLHIRMAGVDAPEAAHFGRPAQPYSAESLAWLKGKILGRTLYCQLLRRDQYSRIVAHVMIPPRILPRALVSGKCLQLEMLKAGWVTTYEQAGAEYGKWGKATFLKVEAEAKAAKRGMWKHGTSAETPAEYKRRHAQGASASVVGKRHAPKPTSWLKRLWSKER